MGLGHPRPPEGPLRADPSRRRLLARAAPRPAREVKASIINTSSTSGLLGNPGQTNYGAAKAGIAAFTVIAAHELVRYGVRVNAIAPAARTRMTEQTPGLSDIVQAPADASVVRRLGPGQHLAARRLPGHRELPGHRQGLLRPGRAGPPLPALDDDRHAREGRPLDRGGARRRRCTGSAPDRAPGRRARSSRRGGASTPRRSGRPRRSCRVPARAATAASSIPWPVLFHRRVHDRVAGSDRYQWWVLWTVLAGLLSVNITFTVFVVALPKVAHELHTTVSTLTWTSTGPAARLRGRRAGSRQARRPPRLPAPLPRRACPARRSAWCSPRSAPTAGVLIAARLLDGVQGAATGAASMALVLQAFSHEDRVKAMGWWALVGAGGPVLGVTIGAPIIQYYRLAGPVLGRAPADGDRRGAGDRRPARLTAGARRGLSPDRRRKKRAEDTPEKTSHWRELDWGGSATLSGSVVAGLLALNRRSLVGIRLTEDDRALRGQRPRSAVAFVFREHRAPSPLIPLRYFRRSQLRLPARLTHVGRLRLHGRVLPLPHPHGERLRLQRDRGRPALDGPPAHVLVVRAHRRIRRGQGGGAVVDRRGRRLRPSPRWCVFTQVGPTPRWR